MSEERSTLELKLSKHLSHYSVLMQKEKTIVEEERHAKIHFHL